MEPVDHLDNHSHTGGEQAHGDVAQVCEKLASEVVVHSTNLPGPGRHRPVRTSFSPCANRTMEATQK